MARLKWGTSSTKAKPFTMFIAKKTGKIGVRIGTSKPFLSADEVSLNAGLCIVTIGPDGIHVNGEGVVRKHGTVVAITP